MLPLPQTDHGLADCQGERSRPCLCRSSPLQCTVGHVTVTSPPPPLTLYIVGKSLWYVFVKRMKCHSKFIKKFHQSISLYDFHNYHYVHIDSPPMFYPEINWPSIWMSRPNHADLEERLAMALLLLLLILGSQQMYHNIFLLFILVT